MRRFLVLGLALGALPVLSQTAPWVVKEAGYRVTLIADAGPYRRCDAMVAHALSGETLRKAAHGRGYLDVASLQLFEIKPDTAPVATPCDYAGGRLFFVLSGRTAVLAKRTYALYFNLVRPRPQTAERRGAVLKPGEAVPGENLVRNPSFEAPVTNAQGRVLRLAEIAAIQQDNPIPDADLEKGEWKLPEAKSPLKLALEKGAGRNGSIGLVLDAQGAVPDGRLISPVFPVEPKGLYRFRYSLLIEKQGGGPFGAILHFMDGQTNLMSTPDRLIPAHSAEKPNVGWRQMCYMGVAPEKARYAVVLLQWQGLKDTRASLDDFSATRFIPPPGWWPQFHYIDPEMEFGLIDNASDGKVAVRLSTSPKAACTMALTSDRFPIQPNTTYTGGCDMQIPDPAAQGVTMSSYDQDGKGAGNVMGMGANIPGQWASARSAGKTSTNAVWGVLSLSIGWSQGTAFFDNVWIKEVPAGAMIRVSPGQVERKP